MRHALALILAVAFGAAITPSAEAKGYDYRHHRHWHHYGRYLAHRHYAHLRKYRHVRRVHHNVASRSGRPGCFYTAASMGGPCGCWAEWSLLGRIEHVLHDALGTWNPWLADDWARHFPRVAPEAATAVVWRHRHVAPIVPGTYRAGTVVVRDSWATHRVRTAGLVFVESTRAFTPHSPRRLIAWPSSVPL